MTRITIKDVRAQYQRYVDNAELVGFDTSDWRLIEGSQPMGVAYRSYTGDGWGTAGTLGMGYLGATAREAEQTLHVAANVLWECALVVADL